MDTKKALHLIIDILPLESTGIVKPVLKAAIDELVGKESTSWQQVYVEAFQEAVQDVKHIPALKDADHVAVNEDRLTDILAKLDLEHQSEHQINQQAFVDALANVLAEQYVLETGGEKVQLTAAEYKVIVERFVPAVNAKLYARIDKDDDAFRRAIHREVKGNAEKLDLVISYLDDLRQTVQETHSTVMHVDETTTRIEHKVDELLKLRSDPADVFRTSSSEFIEAPSQSKILPQPTINTLASHTREKLLKEIFLASAPLRSIKSKIQGVHLSRAEVSTISQWVETADSNKTIGVLLGQPGYGKSVIMKDLLLYLEESGIPVLGIKADSPTEVDNQDITTLELPLSEIVAPILHVAQRLAEDGPVVILLDQIDALSMTPLRDQTALNRVFQMLTQLQEIDNARVIVSCRVFDFKTDPVLSQLEVKHKFELKPLESNAVDRVLEIINKPALDKMPSVFQELLTIPLYLELYTQIVESEESHEGKEELQTLQDFYQRLWEIRIESTGADIPTPSERKRLVYKLVEDMRNRRQWFSPISIADDFPKALQYLVRTGFIEQEHNRIRFLHQTLFDYCYARDFVSQNKSLAREILNSAQGLFQRSQMIQILAYLREVDPRSYQREMRGLLFGLDKLPPLRTHLRLLLIQWLGWLRGPTDSEASLARRLLRDQEDARHFLEASEGNIRWLELLDNEIRSKLASSDDDVVWYTVSFLKSFVGVQPDRALQFVDPYLNTSGTWDNRIVWLILSVEDWGASDKPLTLLDYLIERGNISQDWLGFCFRKLGESNPADGCLVLRKHLDLELDAYLATQAKDSEAIVSELYPSPSHDFQKRTVDNYDAKSLMNKASIEAPISVIEHLLPWYLRAASSLAYSRTEESDNFQTSPYFLNVTRTSFHNLDERGKEIGPTLADSLAKVAQDHPKEYRELVQSLSQFELDVAQKLVARGYLAAPRVFKDDIVTFLTDDIRRLDLWESIQLYGAVFRYLDGDQRRELEALILDGRPFIPSRQNWQHYELNQLEYLNRVEDEYLSNKALRRKQELLRKYPGFTAKQQVIKSTGGIVTSPLDKETQRNLSKQDWLRVMRRYDETTSWDAPNRDLNGGIIELSRDLEERTKEQPEKFYQLALLLDGSISEIYIAAIISGLAHSDNNSNYVFDLVRLFASRFTSQTRIRICRSITELDKSVPDDLLDLMADWALTDPDPDVQQEQEQIAEFLQQNTRSHDELEFRSINSVRGVAVRTVCHCALKLEPARTDWVLKFLEQAAQDASRAVRVSVVKGLGWWQGISEDKEPAITLFNQMLQADPVLLYSHAVHEVLFWACLRNLVVGRPYLLAMLDHPNDNIRLSGAHFSCLVAFEHSEAQDLANIALAGDIVMRKGAAQIYAYNLKDPQLQNTCEANLIDLFNDESVEIRQEASTCFRYLESDHIYQLRDFIKSFLSSSAMHEGAEHLFRFLSKHATDDQEDHLLFLSAIERLLDVASDKVTSIQSPLTSVQHDLVPRLLRICHETEDIPEIQDQALNIFGRFLSLEGNYNRARKALKDFDKDWISVLIPT